MRAKSTREIVQFDAIKVNLNLISAFLINNYVRTNILFVLQIAGFIFGFRSEAPLKKKISNRNHFKPHCIAC